MSEESLLNEDELDREFRELADAFIDLANERMEQHQRGNIGMAMLYASARFNAFVVASSASDVAGYQQDVDEARTFFNEQYAKMLDDNFKDYEQQVMQQLKYGAFMKKDD